MTRALFIGAIMSALLLAACGRTVNAGNGDAGASATATATAVASTLNGCPGKQASSSPLPAASTVVTQVSGNPTRVTLNIDQTVEVRLPANFRWGGGPNDPNHILSATADEGWFDATLHTCIWRYTATKAGSAALTFSGTFLCEASKPCPAIATVAEYDVTAH